MKKLLFTFLISIFCTGLFGQKIISGTVTDSADDEPIPGASIQVKGTTRGTITDMNGNYQLTIEANDKVLEFSFIGMKKEEVQIRDRSTINVAMSMDAIAVDEVVVTALGIKREAKALSYARQGVDTETMAEVKDPNIISSLSGKIAGVQITPPNGSNGSARIVIRGNNSFTGNNQPLFVVDGMPIDNSAGDENVGSWGGGIDYGNGATDINPEDIESMEVLKGPNAAALYGSRAANGVILITTKKGNAGKFRVNFNSNTMFNKITQFPNYQNVYGVGHVMKMMGANSSEYYDPETGLPLASEMVNRNGVRSWGGPMVGQKYISFDGTVKEYLPEPDNVKDFFQTARLLTNTVSMEGGNDKNSFRLSFTNYNADDFVEKMNISNKNTFNIRVNNQLLKTLSLDTKITYIEDKTKNRQYLNGNDRNPVYSYLYMPRSLSLDELRNHKDEQGNEYGIGGLSNPYWAINENHNSDKKRRVMGNIELAWQVFPWLRASARYGKDTQQMLGHEFNNKGAKVDPDGFYKEFSRMFDNNMYEGLLHADYRFKDFSINATFGTSRHDFYSYNNEAYINSLKQADFAHISNSDDHPIANEDTYRKRINSVYGSVSLGYKNYAYLDFTARNDWSSTLPAANNSYFYPSVGLSIIPSDMFKIPTNIFFGKIRASYAMVGNDTSPYRLKPYANFDGIYNEYSYATLPTVYPNDMLKPEKTYSYEIGTDLRFLNGRINLDFTYYYKKSKDQIIEAQTPTSSGYERRIYNAGSIENYGVEFLLSATPVQRKDFTWDISANFGKNNSMVLDMPEGVDRITLNSWFKSFVYVEKGMPYGVLRARTWKRDEQGRRLVDANGTPLIEDDQYLGNANPDFLGGISNRFRYKDFDLYVLIDFKKGGGIFSGSRKKGITSGVFEETLEGREDFFFRHMIMGDAHGAPYLWGGMQYNAYYEDGTPCNDFYMPQSYGGLVDEIDELTYYDASFVKLREISLGYTFPKRLLSKTPITNLKLSLVGRNLWIIHQNTPKGLDPEATTTSGNGQGIEYGSLPPTTSIGFDIKLSF